MSDITDEMKELMRQEFRRVFQESFDRLKAKDWEQVARQAERRAWQAEDQCAELFEAVADFALELEGTHRDQLLNILARFPAKQRP